MKLSLILPVVLLLTAGCGSSSSDSKNKDSGPRAKAHRVIWEQVPSEFSPHIEEESFRTDNIDQLKISVFNYNDDVELLYSREAPDRQVVIRMYRVFKDSATWGGYYQQPAGRTLTISKNGTYRCDGISIVNGRITSVKGGCYVRMQIILPLGSEIEVENAGLLLSKRFIPIDNKTLIEKVRRGTWANDKIAAINEFLASYGNTNRRPALTAKELKEVLHEFSRHNEKMEALRLLQAAVYDRENLAAMIDDEFPFSSEKADARRAVGLPPQ